MSKVEVIPGDLAQPHCGISAENQSRLLPEVQYVIHAAASIQFDNPIHTDLTLSYVASKTIADFAAKVNVILSQALLTLPGALMSATPSLGQFCCLLRRGRNNHENTHCSGTLVFANDSGACLMSVTMHTLSIHA